MRRQVVVLMVLALAFGIAGARQWVPLEHGAFERPAQFRVLSSNSQSTVVELELSGIYVDEVRANGRTWQTVDFGMAGGGLLTEVGAPQLPVVAKFLAIPDDKAVQVRVLESDEVSLADYLVYPAQPPLPENQSSQPFVISDKRYATDALYPEAGWRVSEPMIMRDLRVTQLVMQPARFNSVSGELKVAKHLKVELRYDGYSNVNVKYRHRATISRAFEPLYREFIANYDSRPPQRAEDGSYLIIVNDAFASAVPPFAAWKQRKGWRTKVVTTSEIGGSDTAHVNAYIENAYNTWPYPPDYVLLVGDAPSYIACNHWPGYTDASDLLYSLKEGSDILADLMIARVCVTTLADAQATLNKLYKYEKDPYMGNTQWFNKVVSLAAYEGTPRFWSMVIRVRNYVMGRPFTQFDTLFERWSLNTATNLSESLNQGRAWMLYRGHGMEQGWANVSPSWGNTNVLALNNGRMVPCVIAPTCLSGDFDYSADCHAETWVKAGEEKGGCAYFGSSEVSYSGYNDSLATGSFLSYTDSLQYTFAQCTQWGKLFMIMAYPLPDNITEEETYMFNSFGEPELNVWSATPKQLTVNHPATVLIGSFPFQVTVSANDAPVANAQVCVMSAADTTVYHVGHTDGSGQVQFTLLTTQPGDSILVTVTGRNLYPYQGAAITISPNSAYITYLRHTISDSAPGGNNDGIINPGEAVKMPLWVKNWGSMAANTVTGKLRTSDPNITIPDSSKSFGTVAPGDSAYTGVNGYHFSVAQACTNGYVLRFSLVFRDANDSVWTSGLNLWVGTAILGFADKAVNDPPPGGNGDGKIDPGETAELTVTLRNLGLGNGYNVSAKLRSGDSRFTVTDSVGTMGTIPHDTTGSNAADPFIVFADGTIPREFVVPCTLLVTADGGYSKTIPLSILVGEVRAIDPIPDGPRTPALYWAYDNSDSAYTEAPDFSWVEIRNLGTALTLGDDETRAVSLPAGFGPFVFYGQPYAQVSVCGNGWVAPGSTTLTTYNNTALPNSSMPPAFFINWDDLYPPAGGGLWYYHDTANHRFIVEWDSVRYFSGTNYDKNEVILYDTTLAAEDGNCVAVLQYLTAYQTSSATVGEQDPTAAIAIQCLFDGAYHRGASSIVAGRAVKFTTNEPRTGVSEGETRNAAAAAERLAVWPNPVRGRAGIRFGLAAAQRVKLAAFDLSGREVCGLVRSKLAAGTYSLVWDGRDNTGRRLAQGVYFLRLETETGRQTVKAVLTE